ncbi:MULTISPECIES: hypothetical protein [Streptomyces]|uniref:Uncharacterized protein n=1 Tax=Streptomyces lienomycini TaxID=284035 RepID=A0ABV9X475_9ACTN|nr:hypothetical protein [Streptomyces sp. NBC_00334]
MRLLETADDGKVTKRLVTGLPLDAKEATLAEATPEHVVLVYQTSRTWQWALVDLATTAVVQHRDMRSASDAVAVSDTGLQGPGVLRSPSAPTYRPSFAGTTRTPSSSDGDCRPHV